MAAIVIAVFALFRKTLSSAFSTLLYFRDRRMVIPKALRTYKDSLSSETLQLNHSWKLEGQSLKELIAPIHILEKKETERFSLAEHIKNKFSANQTVRLALLGEAGSGKSVAMGLIARTIWEIPLNHTLLPVLLTFSEIKTVTVAEELEKIIIRSLEKHQFEQGKRNNKAEAFVKENLYKGNMLLLLDGFDELDKNTRFKISKFLNDFFKTHALIHFVISSRNSVWRQNPNVFAPIAPNIIKMAEFTPLEIRMFVSQWQFIGNKSSEQLADIIAEKAYLKAIAVNPLMLTIITFLYAQPKRILPDNRVKFYAECIDALMEKWDNAKALDRANEFETIDKITILSKIAYRHISDAKTTDEEIKKDEVLNIIGSTMKELSRPVEKREKMLSEIIQNAELLIDLPPDGFKFPHRTFMEYFAAVYFNEQNRHEELLKLYEEDKGKWQETLALFCGLNTNSEISDVILTQLLRDFEHSKTATDLDTFVFRGLVESARINEVLAHKILDSGQSYLQKNINKDIIESLGYIAVNPNWHHGKRAKEILTQQLNRKLNKEGLQQVIIALVNVKDEDIKGTILKHAEDLDLVEFMKNLGNEAEYYAIKLMDSIGAKKREQICKGLREGGALEFLVQLMHKSDKPEIRENAAYELAMASSSPELFKFLDRVEIKEGDADSTKFAERQLKLCGWNRSFPATRNGQLAAYFLSYSAAIFFIRKNFKLDSEQMNPWLKLIVSGVFKEKGFSFSKTNLFDIPIKATKRGIIQYQGVTTSTINNSGIISISILLLYFLLAIFNTIMVFFEKNWIQLSVAVFMMTGLFFSILMVTLDSFVDWVGEQMNAGLKTVFLILICPFLIFVSFYNCMIFGKKWYKFNYLIILIGIIFVFIIALLPFSGLSKSVNMAVFFCVIICGYLGSYINISGRFYINNDISILLNINDINFLKAMYLIKEVNVSEQSRK